MRDRPTDNATPTHLNGFMRQQFMDRLMDDAPQWISRTRNSHPPSGGGPPACASSLQSSSPMPPPHTEGNTGGGLTAAAICLTSDLHFQTSPILAINLNPIRLKHPMTSGNRKTLIEAGGMAKTTSDLQRGFSLLEFLDLCTIIEGAVLCDTLVVVGNPLPLPESARPWLDEGIVLTGARTEYGRLSTPLSPILDRRLGYSSFIDSWHEISRLVGAESKLKLPDIALLRQQVFHEQTARVARDHAACDLIGRYKELSEAVGRLRTIAEASMVHYVSVPTAPIALQVLQRSVDYEDLFVVALELRDRYAALRRHLSELRGSLADPSVSPQKKLWLIKLWTKSWQTLAHYDNDFGISDLALTSNGLLELKLLRPRRRT